MEQMGPEDRVSQIADLLGVDLTHHQHRELVDLISEVHDEGYALGSGDVDEDDD